MQIVEVKNNLVKIIYDTSTQNLILSGFVSIRDTNQSFIGQVVNLDANSKGNFAIIKLLFTFNDEGVITNYNGSIPNVNNTVDIVYSQELLGLLPVQTPILFGELAQQNTELNLDINIFENRLLICSEKEDDNELLIGNMTSQLTLHGKKLLIFDLNGNLELSQNKIIAGKNFKLPLNYNSINFIYNGLENASSETKALIQEIFLEVQNYVKTLPQQFIPFESFKSVVDEQYEETELVELLLLKNKLLKYYEEGIFAQEKSDFESLITSLQNAGATIFDLSEVDGNIQREIVSYAYSLMKEIDEEFYVILNVENDNSDKKLLKQIFTTKNVYSTLICPYSFKYLNELKQLSKNTLLFAPIQQQNDFAIYNIFVNKLNPHEFVIYGYATHHIPFIVKLAKFSESDTDTENTEQLVYEDEVQPEIQQGVETLYSQEESFDEEIKRDVDEIYTAPKGGFVNEEPGEIFQNEFQEEQEIIQEPELIEEDSELTEEDLDFIDEIGVNEEYVEEEQSSDKEIVDYVQEEYFEQEPSFETEDEINFDSEQEFEESEIQENEEVFEEEQEETFSDVLNLQAQEEAPKEFSVEPPAEPYVQPPVLDILPASMSSTPIVPIYSADVEPQVQSDALEQGDVIVHPKYGKGTVEKLISYGSKTLCSINFDNVGRRLLDPNLAELKKV